MTIATNAFQAFTFTELACIKKALLTMHCQTLELEQTTDWDVYFTSQEIETLIQKVRAME